MKHKQNTPGYTSVLKYQPYNLSRIKSEAIGEQEMCIAAMRQQMFLGLYVQLTGERAECGAWF